MTEQQRETLETQVKVLKSLLDGMDCFLYWDNIKEQIMLMPKHGYGDVSVPIIQED